MSYPLRWILPALAALGSTSSLPASAQTPDVATGGVSNQTTPTAADDSGQRWKLRFYGFVEFDAMHDSTQSFLEASLNAPIMPRGTYPGDYGRTQFTARNSRLGLMITAPKYRSIEVSGNINFDFFGNQPSDVTENDFYVVGTMRMRHAYFRVRSPILDFLAGQHPTVFGWGGAGFYPGTVAFLGTVGQVYHHDTQLRLSKTFGDTFQVETAAAALRPAQRDGEIPDIEGGIRLAHNGWRGRTIQGNDRPEVVPLSVGASGLWRHFAVNEYREVPRRPIKTTGWGAAVNAFLPILPASDDSDFSNCLTVTAEASIGTGVADRYSFLTGNARFPALPNPQGFGLAPIYIPNIDSGLVTFDADENLKTINWRALVLGVQYYLPVPVLRMWVTGLYARVESDNLKELTPQTNHGAIFTKSEYLDGSLFIGITPDVHIGGSLQLTEQERGNGARPRNTRVHVATNLFF